MIEYRYHIYIYNYVYTYLPVEDVVETRTGVTVITDTKTIRLVSYK